MTNNSYMLLGPISTKLTFSLAIRNNVSAERGIKGDYVLTITGNSLSYTISYDSRLKSHDITQTGTRFKPYISPERQLNFGNLPQGRYDLTVESDCYLLHHMSIDTTTLTSPLIEALLEPKTQINGTVINGDGDPLSDAIVRVNKDISTVSAPDGSFRLDLTWSVGNMKLNFLKHTYQKHSQLVNVILNDPNYLTAPVKLTKLI